MTRKHDLGDPIATFRTRRSLGARPDPPEVEESPDAPPAPPPAATPAEPAAAPGPSLPGAADPAPADRATPDDEAAVPSAPPSLGEPAVQEAPAPATPDAPARPARPPLLPVGVRSGSFGAHEHSGDYDPLDDLLEVWSFDEEDQIGKPPARVIDRMQHRGYWLHPTEVEMVRAIAHSLSLRRGRKVADSAVIRAALRHYHRHVSSEGT